ncbi:MAG: hypothetical protein KJZ93_04365, partial [Caldilineaceae bacterium]|nr:hypothetical protein [Caldilineaceae bacterium]
MSPLVDVYFDDAEVSLIQSPVIDGYEIIRRDVALTDGKLRLRARLQDGGLLEIFMYATEVERQIHLRKYSFH